MGRQCVKLVRVDHATQLNFLLQRLNAAYNNRGGPTGLGGIGTNYGSPLKVAIPIANISPVITTTITPVPTSSTTSSTTTTTTVTSTSTTSAPEDEILDDADRYAIVAELPTPSLIEEELIVVKQESDISSTKLTDVELKITKNDTKEQTKEEIDTTTIISNTEAQTVFTTSTTYFTTETETFPPPTTTSLPAPSLDVLMDDKFINNDDKETVLSHKRRKIPGGNEEEDIMFSGDGDPFSGWIRFPDDNANAVRFPNENSFIFPRDEIRRAPDQWWLPGSWRVDNSRHQPTLMRFWEKVPRRDNLPVRSLQPPTYHQSPPEHPLWSNPNFRRRI